MTPVFLGYTVNSCVVPALAQSVLADHACVFNSGELPEPAVVLPFLVSIPILQSVARKTGWFGRNIKETTTVGSSTQYAFAYAAYQEKDFLDNLVIDPYNHTVQLGSDVVESFAEMLTAETLDAMLLNYNQQQCINDIAVYSFTNGSSKTHCVQPISHEVVTGRKIDNLGIAIEVSLAAHVNLITTAKLVIDAVAKTLALADFEVDSRIYELLRVVRAKIPLRFKTCAAQYIEQRKAQLELDELLDVGHCPVPESVMIFGEEFPYTDQDIDAHNAAYAKAYTYAQTEYIREHMKKRGPKPKSKIQTQSVLDIPDVDAAVAQ